LAAVALSLVFTVGLALWSIYSREVWLAILAVILSAINLQALGIGTKKRARTAGQGPQPPPSDAEKALDVARSMAAAGRHDEALEWLHTAVQTGFSDGARLDADPAWAGLRNDPRFVEVRRALAGRR
jgi:hypothetical protein